MTYKMERAAATFERGDAGIGHIRFSKDGTMVQVTMQVKVGKEEFEQKTYTLKREDCPKYIDLARNAKDWAIQMSADGKTLQSFRPAMGVFIAKTKEFAARENEEPAPKSKDINFVRDGKQVKYSYEYFTVILEIVDDKRFEGLTIPLILRYQFAETVKDGKSYTIFSMRGKYTDALEEYMLVAGILEDQYMPLSYKDNILPDLQRIALHENRKFQVTIKDGWIVPGSLIPFDQPVETEIPFDVEEEEKPESASPFVAGTFDPDNDDEIPLEFEEE